MHKERNLHCDVHVATENKHTLPPFRSLDSFWIMRDSRNSPLSCVYCDCDPIAYPGCSFGEMIPWAMGRIDGDQKDNLAIFY